MPKTNGSHWRVFHSRVTWSVCSEKLHLAIVWRINWDGEQNQENNQVAITTVQVGVGAQARKWQRNGKILMIYNEYHMCMHIYIYNHQGFPGGSAGKEPTCNAGDLDLIPELRRSPGEGNGYPVQYSGLDNSMDYSMGLQRVRND